MKFVHTAQNMRSATKLLRLFSLELNALNLLCGEV